MYNNSCLKNCQTIRFISTGIYNEKDDIGEYNHLTLAFEKYVKVTSSYVAYSGLELLAELGGYVGLFLGISVFQFHEVIEAICTFLARKFP